MPYDYENPSDKEETAPTGGAEDKETKEDMGEATALLPKTVLGGKEFKPGEEVVLKIVHVYEDEVEVAYATEHPEGEAEEEDEEEPMPNRSTMDESMAGMDKIAM